MSEIVFDSCDANIVGAKAANLARLVELSGIQVPEYFVVATTAFNSVVAYSDSIVRDLDKEPTNSTSIPPLAKAIRDDIYTADLPVDLEADIARAYRAFSLRFGEEESLVSVRSSATVEDGASASFAGQFVSCLNVQGLEALLKAVRGVWASAFDVQAIDYWKQQRGPRHALRMGVIVQRMVDATSAGTAYTVDPETGAPMVCINAVHGLGCKDVAGQCTPTSWVIEPRTMSIVKRRDPLGHSPPLKLDVLLELTRQVKRIGTSFEALWRTRNLELEYAIDRNGNLFFTQVRPETVWSQGKASLTAVDLDRAARITRIYQGGMTGCPGVASGVLRVVHTLGEAQRVARAGDILVTPNTTNIWEHLFGRIGGIVTEIGGTGSHTAVVMREFGKPALVGAARVMPALAAYNGRSVTLDATQRLVFSGKKAAELTHRLIVVEPAYQGTNEQSEDAAWREASSQPGRTITDTASRRWIVKPDYPVCRFTQVVLLDAHQWIGERFQVPVTNSIREGVHQIAFSDVVQWRHKLKCYPLEELERLEQEREAVMSDYLDACSRFELEPKAMRNWLALYVKVNAFIGLGFDIYKVTEGLLEAALMKTHTVEPYYTQIRGAREGLGELESSRAAKQLLGLVAEAQGNTCLAAAISASREQQSDTLIPASGYEDFYRRLVTHARNFKVTPVAEIDLPERDAVLAVVRAIRDRIVSEPVTMGATESFVASDGVCFFPEDEYLRRVHYLALAAEKARQDSHHLRVRGHWRIRNALERLAAHLVRQGRIGGFAELFDHSPHWLLEQVEHYRGFASMGTQGKRSRRKVP